MALLVWPCALRLFLRFVDLPHDTSKRRIQPTKLNYHACPQSDRMPITLVGHCDRPVHWIHAASRWPPHLSSAIQSLTRRQNPDRVDTMTGGTHVPVVGRLRLLPPNQCLTVLKLLQVLDLDSYRASTSAPAMATGAHRTVDNQVMFGHFQCFIALLEPRLLLSSDLLAKATCRLFNHTRFMRPL